MAFTSWNNKHLARFNSSDSSEFLELYENVRNTAILSQFDNISHRTFAPSSFRCKRIQWFRLRGVQPDKPKAADAALDFTAVIGTSLHRMVQSYLSTVDGKWVDVANYIKKHVNHPEKYITTVDESSYETLVELSDPPVRFACDGILLWKGNYILLEIKSSDFSSWQDLTDPKPHHIDQTKCYCALLNLNRVFFLYIDRQYGGVKCYDIKYSESDINSIWDTMDEIKDDVKYHICPDALPKGDNWCTESFCKYYRKCSEYGR